MAVVRDGVHVESNVIASQTDLHARYGGVVPEQASRAHLRAILPTLAEALSDGHTDWADVDGIAVTHGPGLAGALLVGVNVAKGLAFALKKPLLGINHLEGHVYANWLETGPGDEEPTFPLVALIVSGGHSDLVLSDGHGRYRRLGRTRDDAAGEAFDKVARLLGLGFPGGPAIEREAAYGDPRAFKFPRARLEPDSWDFSFSGLKTAVRHQVQDLGVDPDHASPEERRERLPVADLAASFQAFRLPWSTSWRPRPPAPRSSSAQPAWRSAVASPPIARSCIPLKSARSCRCCAHRRVCAPTMRP